MKKAIRVFFIVIAIVALLCGMITGVVFSDYPQANFDLLCALISFLIALMHDTP